MERCIAETALHGALKADCVFFPLQILVPFFPHRNRVPVFLTCLHKQIKVAVPNQEPLSFRVKSTTAFAKIYDAVRSRYSCMVVDLLMGPVRKTARSTTRHRARLILVSP